MFIFIAYIFCIIALFLAFKLHDKYDPARYFLLLWGGQIILIYSLFHNSFSFTGYGLLYISFACILFSFGTLAGRMLGSNIPSRIYSYVLNSKRALFYLKICFILSLLNVLQGIYANGFNIRQILSFKILLELNNTASVTRYTSEIPSSLSSQLSLIFVYLTPLFGGYLLPLLTKKEKFWSYISILPSLLISLTQAVKMGFMTSVLLYVIGILVSSYTNNNAFIKIRITLILKITVSLLLFFLVLFLSMVFRIGRFDIDTIQAISEKLITYAFGHLPTFDIWYTKNIGSLNPTGGLKTFYGISNLLGIAHRQQGIFVEYTTFGKNNFSGLSTNVYTMFRFILEDYGILGSLLVVFITGVISGFSWLMIKKQTNIIFFQTILIGILFFISWSFVSSVWAYSSFIATIVLMHLLLILSLTKIKIVNV